MPWHSQPPRCCCLPTGLLADHDPLICAPTAFRPASEHPPSTTAPIDPTSCPPLPLCAKPCAPSPAHGKSPSRHQQIDVSQALPGQRLLHLQGHFTSWAELTPQPPSRPEDTASLLPHRSLQQHSASDTESSCTAGTLWYASLRRPTDLPQPAHITLTGLLPWSRPRRQALTARHQAIPTPPVPSSQEPWSCARIPAEDTHSLTASPHRPPPHASPSLPLQPPYPHSGPHLAMHGR